MMQIRVTDCTNPHIFFAKPLVLFFLIVKFHTIRLQKLHAKVNHESVQVALQLTCTMMLWITIIKTLIKVVWNTKQETYYLAGNTAYIGITLPQVDLKPLQKRKLKC